MAKRYLSLLLILLLSAVSGASLFAQADTVAVARPVTEVLSLRIGSATVGNTYLTPMPYEGMSWGLGMERWRLGRNLRWTHWQLLDLDLGRMMDAGGHSYTLSGRLRYRYGQLRSWHQSCYGQQLAYSVGPYLGADLGFDYNLKLAGSNNPATARATANAGLAVTASYRLTTPRRLEGMRLLIEGHLPLLGIGLMPEYGASYYETFLLANTSHYVHFTSLHNQQDADVRVSLDVPLAVVPWLRRYDSSLRLGWACHIETMDINHIQTRYASSEFVVGWVWQYLPFGRNKSQLLQRPAHEVF